MKDDQSNGGVLANYPIKFAGATPDVIVSPAPPAGVPVEGLPQASFREVVSRDGSREGAVQAVVEPPLGGSYLNIALYMKGSWDTQPQLLERKPVPPAQQNDPVYFDVYQSSLGDGVHVFTYEVERVSGNTGPSIESWALYHRDLPGGNDVPGTGDHPDLAISLPAELGDPPHIGKEEADRGVAVTVSYSFMRAYDRITLELNRERFPFTVQPGQQGIPFVMTVTRDMFERAGNNAQFPISYTVVDQVNNPTDKRRWSKVIEADVNSQRVTLEKPILREDLDDSSDDPNIIDRDKLGGRPLYVVVLADKAPYQLNDDVVVTYISSQPSAEFSVLGKVERDSLGRLQSLIEVPNVQVISGSQISVSFELKRDGQTIGASLPALARVVGGGGVEDWESEAPRALPNNSPTRLKSGLTVIPTGANITVAAYITVADQSGYGSKHLVSGSNISVRFELGDIANFISFAYGQSQNPSNTVVFFDTEHGEIERQFLTAGFLVLCVYRGTRPCASFEVRVSEPGLDHGIVIDKIEWRFNQG
ncbi:MULTISPECIES: hypothetical protein [Pseudomonas]|uniref:hypothetical protein n=1 Tax=Pseudomonas TaxID=286 RepID=UPI000F789068|nr:MULTISPECIES: hypothetical protein [Pseudomonas]RRW54996.1 hypothetical protein EGJ55_14445 [Pseudomonas moraviensis]